MLLTVSEPPPLSLIRTSSWATSPVIDVIRIGRRVLDRKPGVEPRDCRAHPEAADR